MSINYSTALMFLVLNMQQSCPSRENIFISDLLILLNKIGAVNQSKYMRRWDSSMHLYTEIRSDVANHLTRIAI